jgi:hypothetical protein
MDIDKDVTYKYANFYYKILCIVGYTKNKKSDKFIDLKIYTYSDLDIYLFCVAQNTKYVNMIFCTFMK